MSKEAPEPRKTMCATCPFRDGSQYACLRDYLAISALTEATRICHSTGNSVIHGRTGKPERTCRGSRDVQLKYFAATGVIEAPTDAAWKEKWEAIKAERKIT